MTNGARGLSIVGPEAGDIQQARQNTDFADFRTEFTERFRELRAKIGEIRVKTLFHLPLS